MEKGYKFIFVLDEKKIVRKAVATLEILGQVIVPDPGLHDYIKKRTNKARVISIIGKNKKEYKTGFSIYDIPEDIFDTNRLGGKIVGNMRDHLKYKVGRIVKSKLETNWLYVCAEGIHFFSTKSELNRFWQNL